MEYFLAKISTFADRFFYELVKAKTKEDALEIMNKKYKRAKFKIEIEDTNE